MDPPDYSATGSVSTIYFGTHFEAHGNRAHEAHEMYTAKLSLVKKKSRLLARIARDISVYMQELGQCRHFADAPEYLKIKVMSEHNSRFLLEYTKSHMQETGEPPHFPRFRGRNGPERLGWLLSGFGCWSRANPDRSMFSQGVEHRRSSRLTQARRWTSDVFSFTRRRVLPGRTSHPVGVLRWQA